MTVVRIALDLALVAWWIRTVVVISRRPAGRWAWGRAGRIIAAGLAVILVGFTYGIFVPWGAFLVWWTRLRGEWPSIELPMADGRPQR